MTTVTPIKLETGLRPNSAGIPYTLLLGIEAIEFPTLGLLLYTIRMTNFFSFGGRKSVKAKPREDLRKPLGWTPSL